MKIGAIYPQIELAGDPRAVREIGIAVEQLGYDHLVFYDHVVTPLTLTGNRSWVVRTPSAIRSTIHSSCSATSQVSPNE